jgi:hypothetical protein
MSKAGGMEGLRSGPARIVRPVRLDAIVESPAIAIGRIAELDAGGLVSTSWPGSPGAWSPMQVDFGEQGEWEE